MIPESSHQATVKFPNSFATLKLIKKYFDFYHGVVTPITWINITTSYDIMHWMRYKEIIKSGLAKRGFSPP